MTNSSASLITSPLFYETDQNNNPLAGGKVYSYQAGTLTPLTTYTDATLTVPNTNPVILDEYGKAQIWLGPYTYKLNVTDVNNVQHPDYPVDNLQSIQTTVSNTAAAAAAAVLAQLASTASGQGAALVGENLGITGEVSTTQHEINSENISVFRFLTAAQIADVQAGTATFDLATPLQAACTYLSTFTTFKPRLVFPSGRYAYSVSPNWALSHAEIVADGVVYLRNTGLGNSVIIDGGSVSGGVYGLRFGWKNKFIVEGGSGSQNGVYCRAILQGCKLGFQVNGAGTTYSGMEVDFGVCAEISFVCSNNVQGYTWYSQPANGLKLTERGAGELCSYVYFPDPIIEGTSSVGVLLDWAQGNVFLGGTIEGIGSVGVSLTANAIKNKIIGTDFESNINHDVYCLGRGNEFIGLNTNTQITFDGTAVINKVIGGSHSKFLATTNTAYNLISGATYNQNNDGSAITDSSGGLLRLRDNYNQGLGRIENSPPSNPFSISVTASPFTYTNLGTNEMDASVSGGTVSLIQIVRNGQIITMGTTAGLFRLTSQDALKVTYSALPTMTGFTR
jgi:hypothetical protein